MTSSIKEKIFSGMVWSSAGKILSMGASFAITLVLARALSPSDYGSYFIALSTIVIVASVGTLGMDQIVVRFVAICVESHDYTKAWRVASKCLKIMLVGASISCILFICIAPIFFSRVLNAPSLAVYAWVIAIWLFFATLQRQLAETFRGLNDIRLATLFGGVRNTGIVNAVLACVTMLILWFAGVLTLFAALLVMLSVSLVITLVAFIILRRYLWRHPSCRWKQEKHGDAVSLTTRVALYEGWPLWIGMLVSVLNRMGGTWLAGAVDSSDHVALFGVAQRFVLLLMAPMVVVNSVMPPVISQLYASNNIEKLERMVRSMSGILLIPTGAMLAFLIVGGKELLGVLFGSYYNDAYLILIILSFGQIISIAMGTWQIILPMIGARYERLIASIFAVVAQLGLGLPLGHLFGVLGVSVAFCISAIIINVIGMVMVYRRLGIWTYAVFSRKSLMEVKYILLSKITKAAA